MDEDCLGGLLHALGKSVVLAPPSDLHLQTLLNPPPPQILSPTLPNPLPSQVLFALVGKDFVITAADNTAARSIVIQKRGEDKSCELTNHALLLYNGEPGDTGQFSEYITRNIRLYGIKNGIEMTPSAAASFTRRELATSLRSRVKLEGVGG